MKHGFLRWTFDDIAVEAASFDHALPFMREHYAAIFGTSGKEARFLASPMTEAKRRYCSETDVFRFRSGSRTVGMFVSNPSDWSTYYMRSVAILPEYRERRVFTRFFEASYGPLARSGGEAHRGRDVSGQHARHAHAHRTRISRDGVGDLRAVGGLSSASPSS